MTNRAEIVITAVDKATAIVNRIADRMDTLGKQSSLSKSFERLGNTAGLERVNNSLGKISGNVKSIAQYSTVAAGAIGLAFAKSVNDVDDFADSMANAGIKGKGLTDISAVRDYLGQFGVGSEEASAAMMKLTGNMSAARAGAKSQQAAFAAAGITMSDLKNKSPVSVLQKMMDTFSKSDNAGAKLKVLQALAGKSSVKMSEALSQGADAFESYRERSKNALLTEKDFEDAGNAADSLTRISGLFARAGQKMAAAASPKIQAFLDRREAGLLELIPKLVDWVDRLATSFDEKKAMKFFDDVGDAVGTVVSVFRWLNENVGTTMMIFIAMGAVFAPTIVALMSIGTVVIPLLIGAVKMLGLAFLTNPMFLAITLLATAAYMVYKNWDQIVAGLRSLFENLAGTLSAVWQLITGAAMLAINAIGGWFTGLYDSFVSVWDRIASWFSEKIRFLTSMLPDWLTGTALNVNVNAPTANGGVQTSAQTVAGQNGRTEVGGRIQIELTGAPAKVTSLSSKNDRVPIDINAGVYGVGA